MKQNTAIKVIMAKVIMAIVLIGLFWTLNCHNRQPVHARQAASDGKLVYAVRSGSAIGYSGPIGHIELYTYDTASGDSQLVFSDQNLPISLLDIEGTAEHCSFTCSRNQVFALAVDRDRPKRGAYPEYICELTLDGTNRFRKLFSAMNSDGISTSSRLGQIFVNDSGTKIAYLAKISSKDFLCISELNGRLLHQISLKELFLDCWFDSVVWSRDEQHLIISMSAGSDSISDEGRERAGIYRMRPDGTEMARLSHKETGPVFLGEFPDGNYVFLGYDVKTYQNYYYQENPVTRAQKRLPLQGIYDAKISPTGGLFAYLDKVAIPSKEGGGTRVKLCLQESITGKIRVVHDFGSQSHHDFEVILVGWLRD